MLDEIIIFQAREYIARHEGALQERFAMSRSTRDLWARFKIVLAVVSQWKFYRKKTRIWFYSDSQFIAEMAIFPSRNHKFLDRVRAMAIAYQRNWITFWLSRCFLFYIFALAILGEYSHCVHIINVRCGSRGTSRFHSQEIPRSQRIPRLHNNDLKMENISVLCISA